MTRLTQKGQSGPIPVFGSSTDTSLATLTGAKFDTSDGRELVIVGVGASAIGQGLLVQAPAVIPNHQNCALSTVAIGATSIVATLGNTAITANQYAGGYLVINAGTGAGQTLKIQSNTAAAGNGTPTITLEDAVQVATLSSDSKGSLQLNPYNGVIISPVTTQTARPVGVTLYPVTASTYALIQTQGLVSAFSETLAPAVGEGVAASVATAGFIRNATAAGLGRIGYAHQTAVSGEARAIWIDL